MLSIEHEVPLELVRDSPKLILDFLATLEVPLPRFGRVYLDPGDLNDLRVTEHKADAVALLSGEYDEGSPALAVILESQRRHDPEKAYDWFPYVANLWARRRCPVMLLVFAPDESTARKCGQPIEVGHPGLVLTPLVVWPGLLPRIADPATARTMPSLAVLSAVGHGAKPGHRAVLEALVAALTVLEKDKAELYAEYVAGLLPEAARVELEAMMVTRPIERHLSFTKKAFAEGEAKGEAKGKAESVLMILDARGIAVADAVRERIRACTDVETLDRWIKQATMVSDADELFT